MERWSAMPTALNLRMLEEIRRLRSLDEDAYRKATEEPKADIKPKDIQS